MVVVVVGYWWLQSCRITILKIGVLVKMVIVVVFVMVVVVGCWW